MRWRFTACFSALPGSVPAILRVHRKRGFASNPTFEIGRDLQRLDSASLDVMDYGDRWGRYRIRLVPGDIVKHGAFISSLMEGAYHAAHG
jgi:hypothetical protein